ncbi:MAG TPA: protein kinase [Chitinivibrionales bacterium]|nr:protein kinase [Chitinivibrionales bacterium]
MPDTKKIKINTPAGHDQPVPPPPDQFIGAAIGNCRVIEKINEGGTAFIYKAHNIPFDLDRVVKVLKPSLADEEDFFARFRQEAQLTARLDHPNILRVFDTGEVGGHFYIEMEYLAGQTLRDYMRANPKISEREVLNIALQVARALDYAHHAEISGPSGEVIHGILHRDIKPENIMITPAKQVKLMDFGAAKPLSITSSTMQGMIVGTFHYMSPEQLAGGALDIRSDFFSLGIVMYELVTGRKPFTGENLTALIKKISECNYTPVNKVRPSVSSLTEELIDKLLSKNADHRPGTAHEIIDDLQASLQSLTNWGIGRRLMVPFSFRRSFSAIAFVLSLAALILSLVALRRMHTIESAAPHYTESPAAGLLDRGKIMERNSRWEDAEGVYRLVPPMEKGGLANEYLEAQIRLAAIYLKQERQYDKARKTLEHLRAHYSDPAIDAYLGETYHMLGMFDDAKARLDAALASQAGSVVPFTADFKREILFYQASTLDKKAALDSYAQAELIEAVKAWNYFIEFSGCSSKTADEQCQIAKKRLNELGKIDRQRRK